MTAIAVRRSRRASFSIDPLRVSTEVISSCSCSVTLALTLTQEAFRFRLDLLDVHLEPRREPVQGGDDAAGFCDDLVGASAGHHCPLSRLSTAPTCSMARDRSEPSKALISLFCSRSSLSKRSARSFSRL